MTDWVPTTDLEIALRDALRAGDQELYFRHLSRAELLLPVSADAAAGRVPLGWGTWATGGRTHLLAFTSDAALRACLTEHDGSARPVSYQDLADNWPNEQWWLAVDPGLPIEAFLPPWFVAQLLTGDVRLPGPAVVAQPRAATPGRVRAAVSVPQPGQFGAAMPTSGAPSTPSAPSRFSATGLPQRVAGQSAMPGVAGGPGTSNAPATASAAAAWGAAPAQDAAPAQGGPAQGAPATPGLADPAAAAGASGAGTPPLPKRVAGAAVGVWTQPPPYGHSATAAEPAGTGGRTPGETGGRAPGETGGRTVGDTGGRTPGATTFLPGQPAPTQQPPVPAPGLAEPREPGRGGQQSAPAEAVRGRAAAPVAHGAGGGPSGVFLLGDVPADGFVPANKVEEALLDAASHGQTDRFLSTLLLATVLLPVRPGTAAGPRPGSPGFQWRHEEIDGQPYLAVFTSPDRLAAYTAQVEAVPVRFVRLIHVWPDESWSFAVNPDTPIGATLPGTQVRALASWAAEAGLSGEIDEVGEVGGLTRTAEHASDARQPTTMQKVVPPAHVPFYLERGYDRVCGFVHRASELAHLTTPQRLYAALGLVHPGSGFSAADPYAHVIRWSAVREEMYRIPYGGQHEAGMRAMQGWVIERAPFRGNGFAPSETSDVIAEFKVDSARLPHGAQMWRINRDGTQTLVAVFDADGPMWTEPSGGEA